MTVAGADIDGNALADNIIVGSGPGMDSQVKVFASTLAAEKDKAPDVFSTFTPYAGSGSGVSVATGMVELGSGRESIVTAPGPGDAPQVKTFRFDLFTPTARAKASGTATEHQGKPNEPKMTSNFLAYDEGYTGGVVAVDRVGRGRRRAVPRASSPGSSADRGTVRVWSNGSRLDGFPAMYTESPDHHEGEINYRQIASFEPFAGATGVTVATTSTTSGADLLVSGAGPNGAEVRKLALARPDPAATTVAPTMIAALPPLPGVGVPAPLGGA